MAHWSVAIDNCTVTSPNGGTQVENNGTRTVTIALKEGENVTCEFNNTHDVVSPDITTQVKNDADDSNVANGGARRHWDRRVRHGAPDR